MTQLKNEELDSVNGGFLPNQGIMYNIYIKDPIGSVRLIAGPYFSKEEVEAAKAELENSNPSLKGKLLIEYTY